MLKRSRSARSCSSVSLVILPRSAKSSFAFALLKWIYFFQIRLKIIELERAEHRGDAVA